MTTTSAARLAVPVAMKGGAFCRPRTAAQVQQPGRERPRCRRLNSFPPLFGVAHAPLVVDANRHEMLRQSAAVSVVDRAREWTAFHLGPTARHLCQKCRGDAPSRNPCSTLCRLWSFCDARDSF